MARCPVCGSEAPVELAGGTEVTVGTIAVAVDRRPVVACPEGHRVPPAEVVDAGMTAVRDQVSCARSRLLRGDACVECGDALTMPARRTVRPVTVTPPGEVGVLTLRFDLPSTRCAACGTDQVPSRSQEDLTVAVPAVFAEDP